MANSIRTKLLIVVCISYILSTAAIVGFGIVTTKQIITSENEKAYTNQLEVILRTLQKRHEKLTASGMAGLFADGYKKSTAKDLGALHYADNQKIYPFIVDTTGLVVLHPTLAPGSAELVPLNFIRKMLSTKNGTLQYRWRGDEKWMVFQTFEPWHWTIGYAIKAKDKYASVQKVVRNIAVIMVLSSLLGLVAIYSMLSRIVGPIRVLAEDARIIGDGQYEHQVAEVKGRDEISRLAASFSLMAQNISDRDKEIRGFNEQLEQRVQQRTAALEESQKRFRDVALSSADWIWELNCDGRYTYSSGRVKEILGYDHDEIIGKTAYDLMSQEEAVRISGIFIEAGLRKQAIIDIENWNLTKEGKSVYLLTNGLPVFSKTGELVGYRGVDKDITERKHYEDELKRAKEAAEAATHAKSEFLANMSHEIRTPMNGIIGNTALALDTKLTREQHDYLKSIKISAEHLLEVINDILDFSKIEAGHLDLEEIDFDPKMAIEFAVETLAVKAHEKGLEFNCLVDSEVPDYLIGDPTRLRQILLNLGGNAIKFTDTGEVTICCEVEEHDSESALLHFTVSDTGIGIAEDKQDTIFESFSQADGSTTRSYGGTGLGLSISKQLVEMMGGRIWVENSSNYLLSNADYRMDGDSEKLDRDSQAQIASRNSEIGNPKDGFGSTFHFTAKFLIQNKKKEFSRKAAPIVLKDKRVLIVDDNDTNRMILRKMLSNWGIPHNDVPDGETALKVIKEAAADNDPYDLVLMDGQMPKLDGFEVSRRIKEKSLSPSTIIVMVTSMGLRGDAARCRELGIEGYLVKPVKQSELLDTIMLVFGGDEEEVADRKATLVTRHTICEDRHRRKLKILLAEDNYINQQMAVKMLEKQGHVVRTAEDGQKVLALLEEDLFDLVLMDVQMPVMDGLTATRQIRNSKSGIRDIPIIAMTAHAMQGDRERCLQAGMDDYISKPFDPQELTSLLAKFNGKDCEERKQPIPVGEGEMISHLDLGKALIRVGGDREFLKKMLEHFVGSMPKQMESLRAMLEEGDADGLAKQAHSLKGSAATLGAEGITAAALRFEQMAKEGNLSTGQQVIDELAKELAQLKEYISQPGWMDSL